MRTYCPSALLVHLSWKALPVCETQPSSVQASPASSIWRYVIIFLYTYRFFMICLFVCFLCYCLSIRADNCKNNSPSNKLPEGWFVSEIKLESHSIQMSAVVTLLMTGCFCRKAMSATNLFLASFSAEVMKASQESFFRTHSQQLFERKYYSRSAAAGLETCKPASYRVPVPKQMCSYGGKAWGCIPGVSPSLAEPFQAASFHGNINFALHLFQWMFWKAKFPDIQVQLKPLLLVIISRSSPKRISKKK